jgi:hypothetical protein
MCNEPLDEAAGTTHPLCAPWAEPDTPPDLLEAEQLKHQLIEMIQWADRNSPRSLQKRIGPSEVGSVCDRQIGYRLAGIDECNVNFDPWPAIVGTSLHAWLEGAVQRWSATHGSNRWITETNVPVNELISGTADLFDIETGTVIDHKGAGPDVMKQVRAEGPKPEHRVQVQLYGLGYENTGRIVKRVAVVYYPRSGWLRDCYVWVAPYDRDTAYRALDRLPKISQDLLSKDILANPHRWEQVPATPSKSCGLCPWYDPGRDIERGADQTGCPGR